MSDRTNPPRWSLTTRIIVAAFWLLLFVWANFSPRPAWIVALDDAIAAYVAAHPPLQRTLSVLGWLFAVATVLGGVILGVLGILEGRRLNRRTGVMLGSVLLAIFAVLTVLVVYGVSHQ